MPYGNINVDTVTTSTTGGILGAGNASIMKNRLINSDMRIDQRNAGASGTASAYTVDRWQFNASLTTKGTWQQNAGSVTPPIGFTNYLGFTSNSAYTVGASELFTFQQRIEGYNVADLGFGTANAKTIILSFWVRSSLTGTFGGSLRNGAGDRSYPFSFTISSANTWEYETITIAGDTSGTWLTTNGIGIIVTLSLGAGSTVSGTAGAWTAGNFVSATGATSVVGTNGATFYITGVQLEVGSSATGFEYVNYQTSLANCQRYYYKRQFTGGYRSISMLQAYGSSGVYGKLFDLPVTMRTTPTASLNSYSYFSFSNATSTPVAASAGNLSDTTADYVATGSMTGSTGLVAGNASNFISISALGYIDASAEL
jgi:hypothetical protein